MPVKLPARTLATVTFRSGTPGALVKRNARWTVFPPPTKTVTGTTTVYSPAIDHGLDGATCVNPDARQVARQDVPGVGVAACDSGAAEFNYVP